MSACRGSHLQVVEYVMFLSMVHYGTGYDVFKKLSWYIEVQSWHMYFGVQEFDVRVSYFIFHIDNISALRSAIYGKSRILFVYLFLV